MFVIFPIDKLVNHKSARSSLMWHSQTAFHEDREKDLHFCKRVPFLKNGLWDGTSLVSAQVIISGDR